MTLAILQQYTPNRGDGWSYTLEALKVYLMRTLSCGSSDASVLHADGTPLDLVEEEPPTLAMDLIGSYLDVIRLLGRRTAELHLALALDLQDPNFAPEPVTAMYRRSRYQSQRSLTGKAFRALRKGLSHLPERTQQEARELLRLEDRALDRFRVLSERATAGSRIRCHGNYHLGQVLVTGDDFAIVDFEGEPSRHLSERRLKRVPLWDVAGMLRSLRYAAHAAVSEHADTSGARRSERAGDLERWARYWRLWVSAAFLREYLHTAGGLPGLLPVGDDLKDLLESLLLETVTYELGYELNNRPDWVHVPVRDALEALRTETDSATDTQLASARGPVELGSQ